MNVSGRGRSRPVANRRARLPDSNRESLIRLIVQVTELLYEIEPGDGQALL
jgi:hypothetical protein